MPATSAEALAFAENPFSTTFPSLFSEWFVKRDCSKGTVSFRELVVVRG
jgi:hypothetical protein